MMHLTPKQAVEYAFPRHRNLDMDQTVSLLQYLFKEGFIREGVGVSVKFTPEGRAVVAERRKELGISDQAGNEFDDQTNKP